MRAHHTTRNRGRRSRLGGRRQRTGGPGAVGHRPRLLAPAWGGGSPEDRAGDADVRRPVRLVRAADDVSDLPSDPEHAPRARGATLRPFLRYFVGLGTWGFGGPIATVGYMQRDLVERRKWITERDFLNGVALGQTMPGPLAAQVALWV